MTRDWSALPSANSLWEATAEPARAFPVLSGERQADVVIIGAGYTGLSAAHHIAKSGLSPVVLEANRPGWGASGRNGGVITAKFRLSFREIDATHGRAMAQRMYEIAHESTDMVEELVSEFGIASAALTRTGQVKAAHNETTLKAAIDEANWMTREMGSAEVRILDKHGVRDETGSDIFVGGVLNPGSGGIHPLNYLRGLADGVARRGVAIFQESPVVKLRRENSKSLRAEVLGNTAKIFNPELLAESEDPMNKDQIHDRRILTLVIPAGVRKPDITSSCPMLNFLLD